MSPASGPRSGAAAADPLALWTEPELIGRCFGQQRESARAAEIIEFPDVIDFAGGIRNLLARSERAFIPDNVRDDLERVAQANWPKPGGVRNAVEAYSALRTLAWIAERTRDESAAQRRHAEALAIARTLRGEMWDARAQRFRGLGGEATARLTLYDFTPFMTDVALPEHVSAIYQHLLNPREFWTEWPFPTVALDDLPEREAPRVSPAQNVMIADALCRAATTLDVQLHAYAVASITRFCQMLAAAGVEEGHLATAFDARTGEPLSDVENAAAPGAPIADLIVRRVVGLQPQLSGAVVIDPMHFGLKRFELTNCRVAGEAVEVKWTGKRLTARVGRRRESTDRLTRIVFSAR